MTAPSLSIVVPCYNEEACLAELHERLSAAAKSVAGEDYEIVLINDGSRDGSWEMMRNLAAADPRLVAINLSRNTAQRRSRRSTLRGERIRSSTRLQDPRSLTDMMPRWKRGRHVVYACDAPGGETSSRRRRQALRLLSKLADIEIPSIRAIRLMKPPRARRAAEPAEQGASFAGPWSPCGIRRCRSLRPGPAAGGETNYPLGKMMRSRSRVRLLDRRCDGEPLGLGRWRPRCDPPLYRLALPRSAVEGWTSRLLVGCAGA